MTFWRGETLASQLPELEIVRPFDVAKIDCAAYTLSVGTEIYVSPGDDTPNPKAKTKLILKPGEGFTIPPGQFAFIATRETVKIPATILGFISIKTTLKFKGLVNVSGFHVDPGFSGQLVFAVFNAGPATVHLQEGLPAFLIWFARLDGESKKPYIKTDPERTGISTEILNGISGTFISLEGLAQKIKENEKKLHTHTTLSTVLMTVATILIGLQFKGCVESSKPPAVSAVTAPLPTVGPPTSVAPGSAATETPAMSGTPPPGGDHSPEMDK